MNKSNIFFKIIKNIFACFIAFILSGICVVTFLTFIQPKASAIKVNYINDQPSRLPVIHHIDAVISPEYCIKMLKIKDNINNERYLYCRLEDSIDYDKNDNPIKHNKVFSEYYYDENKNVTEIIGSGVVNNAFERNIYNDKKKLILHISAYHNGFSPIKIAIYK